MFEKGVAQPMVIGRFREAIRREHVAPIDIVEYDARDGLPIPALVTARTDVREAGNAPLIVMPHGGPESHDRYGFDWMAQYFAARGYVILGDPAVRLPVPDRKPRQTAPGWTSTGSFATGPGRPAMPPPPAG